MNILFIFPLNEPYETIITANQTAWKSKLNVYKNIKKLDCAYPTGLLSISAYLKKQLPQANIKILDLNAVMNQVAQRKSKNTESFQGYELSNLLEEAFLSIDGFTPDIIGISSLFCSTYRDLKPLSSLLRRKYPAGLIVCGGHLASAMYDRIYQDDLEIDAVVYGEGEIPFIELATAFLNSETKEYLASSSCWITKEKTKLKEKFVPQNKLIEDLDEIPPYDFSVLVFPDVYFNSTKYFFVIETDVKKREIFIFSTRGCPYTCVFCASQNVHGRKVRYYSVERIKSDILYYNKKYNISRFVFYDDHFLIKKDRALKILDFIAKNNLNAENPTPAFFSIDDDIAAAMQRVGVKEVNITIESGNENTLKNIIHKPSNLRKAEQAVDSLHKHGIIAVSNILIGFPGETKEAIDKGVEYLLTTKIDWFQCFVVAPLPGSQLYDICKAEGLLVKDDDILTMDYKKCVIQTKDFTSDYIENKAYEMNLRLNFVNNYDMRIGQYQTALKLFERIISSVIDTHAFAYYYAAKCCQAMRLDKKYLIYKGKYNEMGGKYGFWKEYADFFQLEPLEESGLTG